MTATVLTGATDLSQPELEQARLFLDQTLNSIRGATRGLSPAQWIFKPAAGRWSIAEILNHVVIVQELVLGPIRDGLAHAPAPEPNVDRVSVDAIIIHQFPTRLNRFPAPEIANPQQQIVPAEVLSRLESNYGHLKHWLENGRELRGHVVKSAPLQAVSKGAFAWMDGYKWILAAAAHTERHVKQMLEVMAEPNYPDRT